jgi:hypothetical protein
MGSQGIKETMMGLQEVGIDYYVYIWYRSLLYSILRICMWFGNSLAVTCNVKYRPILRYL